MDENTPTPVDQVDSAQVIRAAVTALAILDCPVAVVPASVASDVALLRVLAQGLAQGTMKVVAPRPPLEIDDGLTSERDSL